MAAHQVARAPRSWWAWWRGGRVVGAQGEGEPLAADPLDLLAEAGADLDASEEAAAAEAALEGTVEGGLRSEFGALSGRLSRPLTNRDLLSFPSRPLVSPQQGRCLGRRLVQRAWLLAGVWCGPVTARLTWRGLPALARRSQSRVNTVALNGRGLGLKEVDFDGDEVQLDDYWSETFVVPKAALKRLGLKIQVRQGRALFQERGTGDRSQGHCVRWRVVGARCRGAGGAFGVRR